VSSEDPEILGIARSKPGVTTLGPRDLSLAGDEVGFVELIQKDAPRFIQKFGSTQILFVTATAALIGPEWFQQAIDRTRENPSGLVLAVTAYERSPMLALTGDPLRALVPLFPEQYSRPTQELPGAYIDAGCFYAFDVERLAGKNRFIDLQPIQGIVLPSDIGVDLDTEQDWRNLEMVYKRSTGVD
jgi:CMP-N-acetylneuraminic acid synthetase